MSEVWIDAKKMKSCNVQWPKKCVVCGNHCDELAIVKAIPSDVTTGGIRFFLGFSRKFLIPVHSNNCEKYMRRSLRITELYPLLGFIAFSIAAFILAATVNAAAIFLIFLFLLIYAGVSLFLQRTIIPSVRITESPATGDSGAYGFEILNKQIANDFVMLNVSIILDH